jgi:hypothetical protein
LGGERAERDEEKTWKSEHIQVSHWAIRASSGGRAALRTQDYSTDLSSLLALNDIQISLKNPTSLQWQ